MSYAYHIPGRAKITNQTGAFVRKVDQDPNTNVSFLQGLTVDEDDFLNDPDLQQLTQNQGKLFHFYDFSSLGVGPNQNSLGNPRHTNFWENKNEFYPDTLDYISIDANTGNIVESLRNTNVRHHHMPCNTNGAREIISGNTSVFNPSQDQQTTIYYFAFGDPDDNNNDFIDDIGGFGGTANAIVISDPTPNFCNNFGTGNTPFPAGFDNGSADLVNAFGSTSNWVYQVPTAAQIGQSGWFLWGKGSSSGGVNAIITDINPTPNHFVQLDQGGGPNSGNTAGGQSWVTGQANMPGSGNLGTLPHQVRYGIFVWSITTPAVTQNGFISHEVQALGIRLEDVKIPKTIADKVQGFRIYYAERKHENRRILGQDILKNTSDVNDWNIAGCSTSTGNASLEDFILSPGSLYKGVVNTATFHDFYLLNRRNSLVPATHTSLEYRVDLLSFTGPNDIYSDVEDNPDFDETCIINTSFSALHMGFNYFNFPNNNQNFQHFPLREKCKTYLNGDSIYDGRGIGFGKRVYNVGGESSILLAYKPNRTPDYDSGNGVGWLAAGQGAVWHEGQPLGAGFAYYNHTRPRVELHNLNAFKTDMYLSYDTQELVWTGFEVVGDELKNYTVEEDLTSSINSNGVTATHRTGSIFGGDTFICRHGYRTTHRPEITNIEPKDHKSLYYVICESTDNINFRHETDRDSSYFPGSPARKMLSLKAELDFTKKDNMKYDESFSLGVADIKPAIPYPLRETDPTIFETRVQRSAKADNTSLIDNYRVFLALQFKDLPRNRGSLHKLVTLNNLLYLHTEDSLFRTKGKQSLKMSDGTESFVGSGDIFAQEPDELIQTKFGYGGTQSQWVSIVTKHGYFCMDYRNRRVFLMKDQLYDIGKSGLESWFQDNIPYALENYGLPTDFDNPILGIGFTAMYDERYDRIILTKRDLKPTKTFISNFSAEGSIITNPIGTVMWSDTTNSFITTAGGTLSEVQFTDPTYFTKTGWTASYNVESNVWVSFHDYIPYKYTRIKDTLVSFNEGSSEIWLHKSEENRGRFYDVDYSTEFEFIYNAGKDSDKVFYSFEYTVDVTDEHAPTIDGGKLRHDHGFNSFYVYTTHQISDEQPIEYMINTRRVGNEWKINKFRDLADLQTNQQLTYVGPAGVGTFTGSNFGVPSANVAGTITTGVVTHLANVSMFIVDGMNETINAGFIDVNKSWHKQRKFRDKWLGIRLKYDNVTKKLINLYSTNVAAKKFYR